MNLAMITIIAITLTSVVITSSAEKCFQVENCTCPNTTRVSCENASFTAVPRNINPHFNIVWLDLNGNAITVLTDTAFEWDNNSAVSIRHLNLHHNEINIIERDALKPLSNLIHLNLAANNISLFPEVILENNLNIRVLSLSRNVHLQLPDSGYNLPNVQKLSLQHCGLKQISNIFFQNMRNITHLNIAGNHLSHLEPDIFAPLDHLEELSVQQNKLTSLTFLLQLPPLVEVELWGNPWHCDCKLATEFHYFSAARSQKSLLCGFTYDNTFEIDSTSYLSMCGKKNRPHAGKYHVVVSVVIMAVELAVVSVVVAAALVKPSRRYIASSFTKLRDYARSTLMCTCKKEDEDDRNLLHNAMELGDEIPSQ